jgi:alkylation response protein AidB-like acyl-CoA dehydrogenase
MTCLNAETRSMLDHSVDRFTESEYRFEQRQHIQQQHQGQAPEHWQHFADMGWLGIAFAEEQGGLGGDITDTLGLMRRFGRALVTEPYVAVMGLAGQLIAGGSNEALREALLPGIISGERRVILAGNEADARGNPYCIGVLAKADDSGFRLSGEKMEVMFARGASELVVSARSSGSRCSPEGIDLFLLPLETPGVTVTEYPMMDGHRGANVRFDGVTVDASQRLTAAGAAGALLARVQQGATLMLVAEALGIMETLLAKTLAYTRARKQFGVALAEFQVLQHRMADMYIDLTNTENLFRQTVARIDTRQGDTGARISRLKARMGLAGRYIGQQTIQLHGGIGMTEELNIGHYFKRLTALDILLGGTEFHIKQIWQQSLAGPATV